ncbi:MAG: hypothetical protein OES38_14170 [Gammaproteobacteria bacterium]|nr:hypothetical protein [Gammaproteobacteria bacterium]
MRTGLERDFADANAASQLEQATLVTAYYGDLTNAVRVTGGDSYDEALDVADLQNALDAMGGLDNTKKFRRAGYEALPSRSSLKEFLADVGAPLLSTLGLTEVALSRSMPELKAYWNDVDGFGSDARRRVMEPLQAALDRDDQIMVIAHCLGSVVAYDSLWQLSRGDSGNTGKIDTLLTLGSPLADEFVKRRLAGSDQRGDGRYPTNVVNWYNVAAEDDFTCHDETMANDFNAMLEHRLISRIKDYRIYNLAVRYGRSNPHNSIGYLIHPRVSKLVAQWLGSD